MNLRHSGFHSLRDVLSMSVDICYRGSKTRKCECIAVHCISVSVVVLVNFQFNSMYL